MLRYRVVVFCVLFLICSLVQGNDDFEPDKDDYEDSNEEPKEVTRRIVNGTRSIPGQFPQQVSLRRRYSQGHFCGGSILTPDWILTASHCMFDLNGNQLKPFSLIVVAGDTILKKFDNAYQWRKVKRIIIHPEYNSQTLHNDLTLLELQKPLIFDPFVNAAPIARTYFRTDTICQVSGWGYQKYEGNMVSQFLLYVDLPLMSVPLCRKLLSSITTLPEGMYCAGYREGGRDACQGDSGGGMLCMGQLTGVVSGGDGCAWPDRPGLYADIKFYLPWIESYVDLNRHYPVLAHPQHRIDDKIELKENNATSLSSPFSMLIASFLYVVYYKSRL